MSRNATVEAGALAPEKLIVRITPLRSGLDAVAETHALPLDAVVTVTVLPDSTVSVGVLND